MLGLLAAVIVFLTVLTAIAIAAGVRDARNEDSDNHDVSKRPKRSIERATTEHGEPEPRPNNERPVRVGPEWKQRPDLPRSAGK